MSPICRGLRARRLRVLVVCRLHAKLRALVLRARWNNWGTEPDE